jgi:hypothetical protein
LWIPIIREVDGTANTASPTLCLRYWSSLSIWIEVFFCAAGNTFTGVKIASKQSESVSLETIAFARRLDLSSETTGSTWTPVLLAFLSAFQIMRLYQVLMNYKYLTKIKGLNQFML